MPVEINPVSTPEDIAVVARLAQEIWSQHFTPIIGASQVDYMLGKFQSVEAIMSQVDSGWEYYLAVIDNEAVGYAGLVPDISNKRLMLSKIYVRQSARGQGVGKSILDYVERKCRSEGLATLWLTVNRFNDGPISWYQKCGFVTVDEVKKDIGSGYFMDDYIMEKSIKSENT
jgi:GNAT superfamily N-acetyltransferase